MAGELQADRRGRLSLDPVLPPRHAVAVSAGPMQVEAPVQNSPVKPDVVVVE